MLLIVIKVTGWPDFNLHSNLRWLVGFGFVFFLINNCFIFQKHCSIFKPELYFNRGSLCFEVAYALQMLTDRGKRKVVPG